MELREFFGGIILICLIATAFAQIDAPKETCFDVDKNCDGYFDVNADMCNKYANFAKHQCAKTCGFCTTMVSPTPTTPPTCADEPKFNCTKYDPETCPSYVPFFTDHCPQFCGFCDLNAITSGFHGKCMYKNKIYEQGEKWYDGCDYECQCTDGSTGGYECTNRCPVLYNVPPSCTLVRKEGECCLEPICDFGGVLDAMKIIGDVGQDKDGNAMCQYKGTMYDQGSMVQDDCTYKCQCTNAALGTITCHDNCPTYNAKMLPANCYMHQDPGSCCSRPKCGFNSTVGVISGYGTTSGKGIDRKPYDPDDILKCKDLNIKCPLYGTSTCYGNLQPYMVQNCPVTCGMCDIKFGKPKPGRLDKCYYQGMPYKAGDVWHPDCQHECTCDDEVYGYYRCYSKCPKYKSLPEGCTLSKPSDGNCCKELVCDPHTNMTFSTTNITTIGGGDQVYEKDEDGDKVPVIPTVWDNGTISTTWNHPTAIVGCLHSGRRLIQGEISSGSNCGDICQCVDANEGKMICFDRCPSFETNGCMLVKDPQDSCCMTPDCPNKPRKMPPKPKTVYKTVEMPDPSTLLPTKSVTTPTPTTEPASPKSANTLPTLPPSHTITDKDKDCYYQNQYYKPGVRWTDGCDYNCICVGGENGEYNCKEMCKRLVCPGGMMCTSYKDKEFPCCNLLKVEATTTTTTTVVPLTAKIDFCTYKGVKHPEGFDFFPSCEERCSCISAQDNSFVCSERCPIYYNIPTSGDCKNVKDPRDPCCTIPVCRVPGQDKGPNLLQPPTFPVGEFQVTADPGKTYCEYDGKTYIQDEEWTIGCDYICTCVHQLKGMTECRPRCIHYDKAQLSPFCVLTTDPADTCCQKATCHPDIGKGNTIHGGPDSPELPTIYSTLAPDAKPGDIPTCYSNGSSYYQGNEWFEFGCSERCRCEDAALNIKTCENRCPVITPQAGCVIITDPENVCCQKKECPVAPEVFDMTGPINPAVILTLNPRSFRGKSVPPNHSKGTCYYKGNTYSGGDSWEDGCEWSCQCVDASLGEYSCSDRCSHFPDQLPSQCRLVPTPGDTCCQELDCSQNTDQFVLPTPLPGATTHIPPKTCQDGDDIYTAGQSWFVGCDLKCSCQPDGMTNCETRCRSYDISSDTMECTLKPDPQDPSCCSMPECHQRDTTQKTPTNDGPLVLSPVAPPGYIFGFGQRKLPKPEDDPLHPKPTVAPSCSYNGQEYLENENWQDGCRRMCSCTDAAKGEYKCTDMCSRYSDHLPNGCVKTRDIFKPCCLVPVCSHVSDNETSVTPTAPSPSKCMYKNVLYQTSETWKDGCDFMCTCDDSVTGKVRCDRICKEYTNVDPSLCVWVTDTSNPCCRRPKCLPSVASTSSSGSTTPGPQVPTSIPITGGVVGYRIDVDDNAIHRKCEYKGSSYSTNDKWRDGQCGALCQCLNQTTGQYKCTERCPSYYPEDLPSYCRLEMDPTNRCCQRLVCDLDMYSRLLVTPGGVPDASEDSDYCVYKKELYLEDQRWNDGCSYTCTCVNTGKQLTPICENRCLVYESIPPECSMVPDPTDSECCQIASCTPPVGPDGRLTVNKTAPFDVIELPGHTYGQIPKENIGNDNTNFCMYKGKHYKTSQFWMDGCNRQCRCIDQRAGLYSCQEKCAKHTHKPQQCTLVQDPDNLCCQKMTCDPSKEVTNRYPMTKAPPSVVTSNFKPTEDPDAPKPIPTADPIPVPTPLPSPRTSAALCTYKGAYFKQFEEFDLDCDRRCRCEYTGTNEINCFNRCPIYSTADKDCKFIVDPNDSCCRVKKCRHDIGDDSSATATPTAKSGNPTDKPEDIPVPKVVPGGSFIGQKHDQTKNIGLCVYKGREYEDGETWKDGCGVTCTCLDASKGKLRCDNKCPIFSEIPTNCSLGKDADNCCHTVKCYPVGQEISTQAPLRSHTGYFCTYKGIKLTEGQMYADEDCHEKCTCVSAVDNHVQCIPRCLDYNARQPNCILVPDSRDPECCKIPKCDDQNRINPYGVVGGYTATGKSYPKRDEEGCFVGHNKYSEGQSWKENCKICTCDDGKKHLYECTSICPSYPDLPPGCVFEHNPFNPCCPTPVCKEDVSSQNKTYCMHHGIPYEQGELIKTGGCSKVFRCEDSSTNSISERDRCPKHTNSRSTGCHLETNPKDSCCQILVCKKPQSDNPLDIIKTVPGNITGVAIYKTKAGSTAKDRVGCFVNNKLYRKKETWKEGCSFICTCIDGNNGDFTCVERCPTIPAHVPPTCRLVQDARDECCTILSCAPPQRLATRNMTALCLFNGKYYRQQQSWYEGDCDSICSCEDANSGIVQCRGVCPQIKPTPGCVLVPDPQNPTCCQVEDCPTPPTATPPSKVGYVWPVQGPPRILFGRPFINSTMESGKSGLYDYQGCLYNGRRYKTNEAFDDGCNLRCICLNATSGEYKCEQRCPSILPREKCVLVQDPSDPCCQIQYCDFTHSKPFPGGVPRNVTLIHPYNAMTPPKSPYEVAGVPTTTQKPQTGSQIPSLGLCLSEGREYLQGHTWNVGCDKTCTCANVTTGLYVCVDRCPFFGEPAPHCQLRPDPSDSCCLVQDCAPTFDDPVFYVTPGPSGHTTSGPNIAINQTDVILTPGNPASYIKIVAGNDEPYFKNGYRSCFLEDGSTYSQGSRWQSGDEYCTCVDASKNIMRCQQECPSYYFLPSSCQLVYDLSNPTCLIAVCSREDLVSPIPFTHGPSVPTLATRPTQTSQGSKPTACFVDGHARATGTKWTDGCQMCECINSVGNIYLCRRSCPVITSLPSYCKMVQDSDSPYCLVPSCVKNGITITPYISGTSGYNVSGPSDQNGTTTDRLPVPIHPVITGSGYPTNMSVSQLLLYGGSDACLYKGQLYRPGQSWNDGCTLTCTCELKSKGQWTCLDKCGKLPSQLPSYCHAEKIPGKCCQSLSCNIPKVGVFNPWTTVHVVGPRQIPPIVPGVATDPYIPDLIDIDDTLQVLGHGYPVTPQQIPNIKNRCIRDDRAYVQGEKWNEGCDVICECLDEESGYYRCDNQCPSYHIPSKHCVMTVIPNQCCKHLICNDPETGLTFDPLIHPKIGEYIYGVLKPGFSGFRPGYVPDRESNTFLGCYFDHKFYQEGQKWESGCGLQCTCVDGETHSIECHEACYTYTDVPSACSLVSDVSSNHCCQRVKCPPPVDGGEVLPTQAHRPNFNISEGSCIDTIENCDSYTIGSCGPQFATWAKNKCPRYCGLCYGSSLVAPTCDDVDEDCASFGQYACQASDTKLWMWKYCHKTCGYCDTCVDVSDICQTMKSTSCRGIWEPWAKLMCAKTCNYCSDTAPTSVPTGTGKIPSGWLLLLKGVSGVPGDLYKLWTGFGTLNAHNTQTQVLTAAFPAHFKSVYAEKFGQCQFEKIRMSVYSNGLEKSWIIFNATDGDKTSWYDNTRIESSYYSDIVSSPPANLVFENTNLNRQFEAYKTSTSPCANDGWMFISTLRGGCSYQDRINKIHYSPLTGASSYSAMEEGDVFAILAKGSVCDTSNPLPLSCPYKNHEYLVGEEWQDGCSKKCNCSQVDQNTAKVFCEPLCESHSTLPPGCRVVKKKGECCGTLVGNTCHGGVGQCMDKFFNVSRAVGETWRVGCKWDCECAVDPTRGYVTQCLPVCLTWDLSGIPGCKKVAPRPGKCCAAPSCPGVTITIPDSHKNDY